ncbi:MAG: TIGR01777 family oxidoreductase [Bacteroidia bacterium]|nr:TIGR01777 family oxidoreductase [Bacteroidia bacterium]
MNILITGGTGFIGEKLVSSLIEKGHQVTILTREKKSSPNRNVTMKAWDGKKLPVGMGIYEVVINLAGASIGLLPWTEKNKKLIMDSRVDATRACAEFINSSPNPPRVFLSASGVGYYGGEKTDEIDERGKPGKDFPAEVCKAWEAEAVKAQTRTVILRIGVVLGKGGGAIKEMIPIYKKGLGGRFASGTQGFPWIHIEDLISAILFLIDKEDFSGPINIVAPHLVDQRTFSGYLAKALGAVHLFIIPKFALKILFGERSVLFSGGQKVIPRKLQQMQFVYRFPDLRLALKDVV